jgi:hypothetical protein
MAGLAAVEVVFFLRQGSLVLPCKWSFWSVIYSHEKLCLGQMGGGCYAIYLSIQINASALSFVTVCRPLSRTA